MRLKCASAASRAWEMEDEEVTSSGSVRMRGSLDGRMEARVEGSRAVATRRYVGCDAMWVAQARPRPEEQPVTTCWRGGG